MREWRYGFGIDEHLSPRSAVREHAAEVAGHGGSCRPVVRELCIRLYGQKGEMNHEWLLADSH